MVMTTVDVPNSSTYFNIFMPTHVLEGRRREYPALSMLMPRSRACRPERWSKVVPGFGSAIGGALEKRWTPTHTASTFRGLRAVETSPDRTARRGGTRHAGSAWTPRISLDGNSFWGRRHLFYLRPLGTTMSECNQPRSTSRAGCMKCLKSAQVKPRRAAARKEVGAVRGRPHFPHSPDRSVS
jgi:hypothetical protein